MKLHTLKFSEFLAPSSSSRFILLILNEPLDFFPIHPFENLWLHASWRICADGGANQLYDLLNSEPEWQRRLIPNLICGDLDSLRSNVCEFYRQQGTKIEKHHCQDTTDFQKCITALKKIEEQAQVPPYDLLVLGGTKGRLDQVLSNLHTLYSFLNTPRQVYIVDLGNYITLLDPGLHRLDFSFPLETSPCGLVPFVGEVKVKTSGLKWNLDDDILKFGTFISTSNERDLQHTDVDIPPSFINHIQSPCSLNQDHDGVSPLQVTLSNQTILADVPPPISTVFVQCDGPLFWVQTLDLKQLES